eukprot:CAMPEP_0170216228 /NCGR_PEP_ID=MMETSP0116_2-20130129/7771_1 /TAXON_ID=400756 /ORGANISM="Durinskia baltica, Strain CSIRO CS-38" /LENGTH=58 /DNA_ID=CAMNT_0010466845 /DNA_START=112 /DNA_END=288 /DNA_ORIENTATION=-
MSVERPVPPEEEPPKSSPAEPSLRTKCRGVQPAIQGPWRMRFAPDRGATGATHTHNAQ